MTSRESTHVPRVILNGHSRERLAKRNLTEDIVFEIECFGRHSRYQPGGADLWRVDRRIVRRLRRIRPWLDRLDGVTVITSASGVCLTAYRNRKGQRLLRKPVRPGRGRRPHR